ncbi:Tat proofreading chaperone DmsD [Yersinia pseudotuberculosis]|uniref:Tat proofreading chaperone DmsD n=1 Tax=Yersinia pseudotuberculosis TaxID=633 RepID=UPI0003D5EBEF|nr:Tat proofreading chaperone DmsD [Yersinia pseudotuberculosis]AJJ69920.1 twin-arginine leader-binding protein dmsD [Yersinia pseudotuberculosis]PSH17299.1 DMSO reductase maturation protein DsmD [Yersinia pseudotuberculosis]PSH35703.1 DMSO reductase maturation protein DsmD [Yersinia pseudotuberculosis]PSH49310.1 DMSO reductase maturation protein DsmD [Yersinia pseudotuberculosis]CNK67753.1 twin-argninine leader-binding protein DmsD [Yersinia pseudotuberculosis]
MIKTDMTYQDIVYKDTVYQDSVYQKIGLTGRVLGALFYCEPDSAECRDIVVQLRNGAWAAEWPYGGADELMPIATLLAAAQSDQYQSIAHQSTAAPLAETLEEAWQRLFIGPYALPAPPWGSVYLDKDMVLFGDSTLKLRNWMQQRHVEVTLKQQEPEDHFGLLMMMAAWLAEHQPVDLPVLLADHLLPWSYRYLALLQSDAGHPFYQGLAQLTTLTLAHWQHELQVTPAGVELYR